MENLDENSFQKQADNWVVACFGNDVARNKLERAHRFLEEALELYQATGASVAGAQRLAEHVFSKPVGNPLEEIGGTMVTLASISSALDINMDEAGKTEVSKLWKKIAEKRAKHLNKDPKSPLPGQAPKTVVQWLKGLPEPYCYEAVELCTSAQEVDNIEDALKDAFLWAETPQGFHYWDALYQTL